MALPFAMLFLCAACCALVERPSLFAPPPKEFTPLGNTISTQDYLLVITRAYWRKAGAYLWPPSSFKVSLPPPSGDAQDLHLGVAFTNRRSSQLDLVCYLVDDAGDTIDADFTRDDDGDSMHIFGMSLDPNEHATGEMTFVDSVNDTRQAFQLQCSLCNGPSFCMRGVRSPAAVDLQR